MTQIMIAPEWNKSELFYLDLECHDPEIAALPLLRLRPIDGQVDSNWERKPAFTLQKPLPELSCPVGRGDSFPAWSLS